MIKKLFFAAAMILAALLVYGQQQEKLSQLASDSCLSGSEIVRMVRNGQILTAPLSAVERWIQSMPLASGAAATNPGSASPNLIFASPNGISGTGAYSVPVAGDFPSNIGLQVNVQRYLSAGQQDGNADSSSQIQALVTSICSTSPRGGTLYFPAGKYIVHDVTAPCPIYLKGQGVNNTQLGYAWAAKFAFRWQVTGFPSFCSQCQVYGAGIEGFALNYTTLVKTILVIEGVRQFYGHHLVAYNCSGCQNSGGPRPSLSHINNFLYSYGVQGMDLLDVKGRGINGTGFAFYGDIAGETSSGGACSTGSAACSTRSDFIVMHDIEADGTSAATGVSIQGFVATVMGEHFAFEGFKSGLSITCQAGLASNLSQCPQFILLDDFQNEFCYGNACLYATDFVDLRMNKPYFYGSDLAGNNNAAYIGNVNYSPPGSPKIGQVTLENGLFFAVQQECILVGGSAEISDVKILNNKIYGCNTANGGYAAINLVSSVGSQNYTISGNTFCHVGEYGGAYPPSYALIVGSHFSRITFEDNITYGCGGRLQNNSTSPYTVVELGNLGPGNNPSMGACGTGPIVIGSDESMLVKVGAGSPTTCTINFGSTQWHAPNCVVMAGSGARAVSNYSDSASALTFNGSSLFGSYSIICIP